MAGTPNFRPRAVRSLWPLTIPVVVFVLSLLAALAASGQPLTRTPIPAGQFRAQIEYPTPLRDSIVGSNREYPTPVRGFLFGTHIVLPRPVGTSFPVNSPWLWSQPAPHHASIVKTKSPSGQGFSHGSGVYVQTGDVKGVLTAAHCVKGGSQRASVIWSDGTETQGEIDLTDRDGYDIGFIVVQHPTIQTLMIAAQAPQPGEWLEFAGFGGGGQESPIRHWWGSLSAERASSLQFYECPVVQGDSGGTILNAAHEVVGVIAVGTEATIGQIGQAQAFAKTGGAPFEAVAAFVGRVATGQWRLAPGGGCGPGGCGPQGCPPGQGGGEQWGYPPQPNPFQRPQGPPPDQQPQPPITPKQTPTPPTCQLTPEQVQTIIEALAKDVRFRGAQGIAGPAGNNGTNGTDGTAGPAGPPPAPEQIQAAIAAWVSAHPAEVAAMVQPHLDPLHVETYDRNGVLVDAESYPYPGPIRLRYGLAK